MPRGLIRSYVLRDRQVVETDDVLEAARWLSDINARTVNKTTLKVSDTEECEVSTVFIPMDLNPMREENSLPICFETLVLGGPMNDWMRRYATWAEAEAGHNETRELVRRAIENGTSPTPEEESMYVRPTSYERIMKDDTFDDD